MGARRRSGTGGARGGGTSGRRPPDDAPLSHLLAEASHDLRQPLQAMGLLISSLHRTTMSGEAEEIVRQLGRAHDAMSRLMGGLLDFSRLDAGTVVPDIVPMRIADLFGWLDATFRPMAQGAGIDLRIVPSSAAVASDVVLLERIVGNFLANAIRHAGAGRIVLGCRRRGATLAVAVCDDGIGIPESEHRSIFEAYRRLDRGAGEGAIVPGLGLGLSIVRGLADILDHPIEVASTPGRGAVFAVSVPLA